jgi:hypothetical protein
MRYLFGFLCVCALGLAPMAGCGWEPGWSSCADIVCRDDGNPCTNESCRCDGSFCTPTCTSRSADNGTDCTFGGLSGVCVSGVCGENLCEDVVCEDDDACTDNTCDYVDGMCDFTPAMCDDRNECTDDTCNPADGCNYTPVEGLTYCLDFGHFGFPPEICEAGACVPVPRDACTNAEDLAVVCDPSFDDEVETCARDAAGPVGWREDTALCLIANTGVSADCAVCQSAMVGCMFWGECTASCGTAPNSEECDNCLEWIGCDCTGDLASACPPSGTMFGVGAFEIQP